MAPGSSGDYTARKGSCFGPFFNPGTGRSAHQSQTMLRTGDDPVGRLDRPRRADAVIFYLFATYIAPLWNNRVSKGISLGPPNPKKYLRGPKSECADARAGSSGRSRRSLPRAIHLTRRRTILRVTQPNGPSQPRTDATPNPASDPELPSGIVWC
jgi:hypothetical protein